MDVIDAPNEDGDFQNDEIIPVEEPERSTARSDEVQ